MPRYIVRYTELVTQDVEAEVNADSPEEALEKAKAGDAMNEDAEIISVEDTYGFRVVSED